MAALRVVVRPHHRPLQVAAVLRLVERLHPVVEVLATAVPVPVHIERADAVLHEPLDLPVHHLWVRLVVPAQHGLALRANVPDALPSLHARPAREVERGDVVVGLDRLRLGHVRCLREAEGRQHLDGNRKWNRGDALRLQEEPRRERARRVDLERGDEGFRVESAEVADIGERGGVREADTCGERSDRQRHVAGGAGADVLDRHAHGHLLAHAVEGVLGARALHNEVRMEFGLLAHKRHGRNLRSVDDEIRPGYHPAPVGIGGEVEVDLVDSSIAGITEPLLAETAAHRRRPAELPRAGRIRLYVKDEPAPLLGGERRHLRRGDDGDRRHVELATLRAGGREVEPQLADAPLALPERAHPILVPLAVADPLEADGLCLQWSLAWLHPENLADAGTVPLCTEHNLLRGGGGKVKRPAVEVRIHAAAHDVQRAVLHGRRRNLVPALRPRGERLGRVPFDGFRPRQTGGEQRDRKETVFHDLKISAHFLELGGGVEEVRRHPEHFPLLVVATAVSTRRGMPVQPIVRMLYLLAD